MRAAQRRRERAAPRPTLGESARKRERQRESSGSIPKFSNHPPKAGEKTYSEMGRRAYRAHAISYPSRVEGWLDVCGEYLSQIGEIYVYMETAVLVTLRFWHPIQS